jgi:hypothetical protein
LTTPLAWSPEFFRERFFTRNVVNRSPVFSPTNFLKRKIQIRKRRAEPMTTRKYLVPCTGVTTKTATEKTNTTLMVCTRAFLSIP